MILIYVISIIFTIIFLVFVMLHYKYKDRKKYYTPIKTGISILILIIAIFTAILTSNIKYKFTIFLISGFIFSVIGDYILSIEEKYFIYGIFSFSLTHIFYSLAFTSINLKINLLLLMLFLILPVIIYKFIPVKPGNLKIPVVLYSLIINLMLFFALSILLYSDRNLTFKLFLFSGTLLFFISDLILGINKFLCRIKYRDYFVGLFYFVGQTLIAFSIYFF